MLFAVDDAGSGNLPEVIDPVTPHQFPSRRRVNRAIQVPHDAMLKDKSVRFEIAGVTETGHLTEMIGKHNRIRTVPMPGWTKVDIDIWLAAVGIMNGRV